MDEVDANLDKSNVRRVAEYLRQRVGEKGGANSKSAFQAIVISHNPNFYERADGLVGVYRHPETKSSNTLSFDLEQFDA